MNFADVKKTIYYLERNGLKKTWYAVMERLEERKGPAYEWKPPAEEELEAQRTHWREAGFSVTFSILTPAYRTAERHIREMIDSLRLQTYPQWELILADATEDDSVERVVQEIQDSRIRYIRLQENGGIARNSNEALGFVSGDYVGLLDHDDVLTENALYEMAAQIELGKKGGMELKMLYSDEDKCNGDRTEYYEPNRKEDFNLDLLLSNNYICHFLVMEREFIQKLRFRPEYDGAQDYDLVLRAVLELQEAERHNTGIQEAGRHKEESHKAEESIVHIPKVLYHWRCHRASTAENPRSKLHAYEAGKRAVQDFADRKGWKAVAEDTPHVGFYALRYQGNLFDSRQDIGAVGGRLVQKGRTSGGRMTEEGGVLYENLPAGYSGYLHRAALAQDAAAVDIRNIRVREECREIFRRAAGVPYRTASDKDIFDVSCMPKDCDFVRVSLEVCSALRSAGYRILYLPDFPEASQ